MRLSHFLHFGVIIRTEGFAGHPAGPTGPDWQGLSGQPMGAHLQCYHHFSQGWSLAVKRAPSLPQAQGRTVIEAMCGPSAQEELFIKAYPSSPGRLLPAENCENKCESFSSFYAKTL